MGYYVMLDKPAIRVMNTSKQRIKQTNKPRKEHKTLELAITEAKRLSEKIKCRALVLEVVYTVEYSG